MFGCRWRPIPMAPYLRCFGYPFRKSNLPLMVLGCVVFVGIPTFISLIPFAGVLALIVQVFLVAYYAVFLHSMLGASMVQNTPSTDLLYRILMSRIAISTIRLR